MSQVKRDMLEEEITWEWDPRHTRLRYQTVISSLLLLSFCRFEVTNFVLPFEIASFGGGKPAQWEFIVGSLLFFLFSAASFFIMSLNESNRKGLKTTALNKKIDDAVATFSSIDDYFESGFSKSFSELLDAIEHLKGAAVIPASNVKLFMDQLVSFDTFLNKFRDNTRDEKAKKSLDMLNWKRRNDGSPRISSDELKTEHLDELKVLIIDDIMQSFELVVGEANLLKRAEVTMTTGYEPDYQKFESQVNSARKVGEEQHERFTKDLNTWNRDVEVIKSSMTQFLKQLKREGERDHKYIALERDFFGFCVPIFTSYVFTGFAFYFWMSQNTVNHKYIDIGVSLFIFIFILGLTIALWKYFKR